MGGERLYVADTNVILKDIEKLGDYKVVLLSHTLREMDKHKSSKDADLSYRARKAVRYIKQNKEMFVFDLKNYRGSDLGEDFSSDYQDDNILKACVDNQYGIITKDILLQYKAEGFGLEVVDLDNQRIESAQDYTGIHKVYTTSSEADQEDLAIVYEHPEINYYKLLTNQYLIIYDKEKPIKKEDGSITYEVIDRFRWNGDKLVKLKLPDRKVVKAKNEEQECALDMLYNKDIPIKIIAGTYGSGKTYLTVKMALHHVIEKGNHAKIMVLRNPIGSGEAIGWLKGSKEDKTQDFFKPFVQHLEGGEQEATLLETRGQLIKEIPYYIKGLSIEDTFVVVDEAEDLDKKLTKLVGTRLGVNSEIVFAGDFKQAEDKYMSNNGLLHAIDKLKGNPLVGIVILEEDVRSDASKVFAEMD
jgi:PhoH-like ATPase